jgi:hypothetical protein
MVRNVVVPAESSAVKVVLRSPPLKSLFTNGIFVNKDSFGLTFYVIRVYF